MDGFIDGYGKKPFQKGLIIVILLFLTALLIFVFYPNNSAAYASNMSSFCLVDVASGRVLKGDNIDTKLPMASTTKAMTALLACESGKLDDMVTIPAGAVGIEGSSIYLKMGEKLSLRDLTYGLMLRSGNDAATAIAMYLGGSVDGFAKLMNEKAQALGLKNTHFVNPHGLHDDNHYTSAYDLAQIAAQALKNPECKQIVSAKKYSCGSGENCRYFTNKNKLLWSYDGATGFKTGFTKKAGRCLIASSERDGLEVVAVVLNVPSMFETCASLMDFAHDNYYLNTLVDETSVVAEIPVKQGEVSAVGVKTLQTVSVAALPSENIFYKINVIPCIDTSLPKGTEVGNIQVFIDERLLFSTPLVNIEAVNTFGDKYEDK